MKDFDISIYLPYIATVLCACISGLISYMASRRQSKSDLRQLEKKYELDMEHEREKFAMEKEKMELEHKHQMELVQKQAENAVGTDMLSTLTKELMKSPTIQSQIKNTTIKKRR